MQKSVLILLLVLFTPLLAASGPARHTFALGEHEFLLDGKPFQIMSGEMHPARIPREYWRQGIRMARAMGCNPVAAYVKGIVWVNGHNLGRYWNIGPQTRLYSPSTWLKRGENEIVVLDIQKNQSESIRGRTTLE